MGTVVSIGLTVVVVAVIVALIVPGRKDKKPAEDGRMSTEEMSAAQREMWSQAEQAVREYADARGAEVAPARERMLRMVDEVDTTIERFGAQGASERQLGMWRIAVETIREFVNEALAKHPEGQQH